MFTEISSEGVGSGLRQGAKRSHALVRTQSLKIPAPPIARENLKIAHRVGDPYGTSSSLWRSHLRVVCSFKSEKAIVWMRTTKKGLNSIMEQSRDKSLD